MGCICAANRSDKSALLVQNLTYLKSTSRRCAHKYHEQGTRYHRLPLHIRNHEVVPLGWQNYCKNAFTVSAIEELPDLIQILAMLESTIEAAHTAILQGEEKGAERRLFVAQKLVEEGKDRVKKLQYAVMQYELLLKAAANVDESVAEDQDQDEKSILESSWKVALPKYVVRQSLPAVSDIHSKSANAPA